MANIKKHCFVIMPFSQTAPEHTADYWTDHFESFLRPLIEENAELEACRSKPLRGDILRQIITNLVVCPVVVADLTDRNPNVYWELGVRQSFKHGTITIAEKGTEIPFDVGVKGSLFYHPKDHVKNAIFCKEFRAVLRDCINSPTSPDSHVLEAISGRGSLFEIIRRDEVMRRLQSLLSECDDNAYVIETIFKGLDEKKGLSIMRLRLNALELLVVNRYLDTDAKFYERAEGYLSIALAMNAQLAGWEVSQKSAEEILMKPEFRDGVTSVVPSFSQEVRNLLEKNQGAVCT